MEKCGLSLQELKFRISVVKSLFKNEAGKEGIVE
jgi:hypothetical protein